jgi:hypothetical protein
MDDHHLGSIKKLLKKTFQIQINVYFGIFLLSDDKRKSLANLQKKNFACFWQNSPVFEKKESKVTTFRH